MTTTELRSLLERVEFHAREAAHVAKQSTLASFTGTRDAVGESEIQRNVAQAHCAALQANFLLLKCHKLATSLELEEE